MKKLYFLLLLPFIACQTSSKHPDFDKNCEAVMTYINGFQNEDPYYDIYSKDLVVVRGTAYDAIDTTTLNQIISTDRMGWAKYNFELITEPNLLPGVDPVTHEPNGSVRYYGTWKVTIEATDSTPEASATIRLYESFDFDAEGKIVLQQYFGDGTGLFQHLNEVVASNSFTSEEDESTSEDAGGDQD